MGEVPASDRVRPERKAGSRWLCTDCRVISDFLSLAGESWNRLAAWLHQMEILRKSAGIAA